MNEHSEEFEDDEVVFEAEVPILTVSAGENEKGSVFRDFLNMRNEASFCDVAFVVQGTLFRAHRVVVSSWSRWLFAMLSEGPDQEIVSLDVFSPQEFGAVLDYMYGEPLEFSLANAEHMLKIVRRLELRVVEQKCWRFLLSIVNQENCVQLHQIADFFECAPLKISAWRIIQESKPGYSAAPTHMISSMRVSGNNTQARRSHGLTGPGEMDTMSNQPHNHDDDSDDDDVEFSIFSGNTPALTEQSEEVGEGLLGSVNKRYDHFIHPDKLPKGTPALQVVKAWSLRLQEVFAECCDYAEDMTIADHAQAAASQKGESEHDRAQEEENEHEQRPISTFSDTSGANRVMGNPTPSSNGTPIMTQPHPSSVQAKQHPVSRSAHRESKAPSRLARQSRAQQPEVSVTEEDTEETHHQHDEQERQHQHQLDQHHHHQQNHHQDEDRDQDKYTSSSTPSAPLDWRQELTDFYIANNLHEKIQSIDAILEAWHGRELDMMEVLHDKYRVEFDDHTRDRLSQ